MAKVLQIAATQLAVNDNLTRYAMAGHNSYEIHLFAEADAKVTARIPGVLSKFSFYISYNFVVDNPSTIRVRKNGANGSQSITVAAGASGWYEDLTNTDTLADGDTFNYQIVTGATAGVDSIGICAMNTTFAATTNTVSYITSTSLNTITTGLTRYYMLSGFADASAVTTNAFNRFNTAGTLKKLYFYTKTNTTTSNSTVKIYSKTASAAGNIVVTVTAGTTGVFEDNTNTDTVADNDEWCMQIVNGGGGTLTLTSHSVCFETTDSSMMELGGKIGQVIATAQTYYTPANGSTFVANDDIFTRTKVRESYTVSNLFVSISANTITASSTYTLRKNGADTSVAITVPASTTGNFEDTTNTASYVDGDYINVKILTGATGTNMTINNFSLKLIVPSGAVDTSKFFLMF